MRAAARRAVLATLVAAAACGDAATAPVGVSPAPAALTVHSPIDSLRPGDTTFLSVRSAGGGTVAATQWTSSDTTVLAVSPNGRVVARMPGTAVVTASATAPVTAVVSVHAGLPVTLDVWPRELLLQPGARLALSIVARTAGGLRIPREAVTITPSDSRVAVVGADGAVTAQAAGEATVEVRAGSLRRVIPLRVEAPRPSQFAIDTRLVASSVAPHDSLAAAVAGAAAQWERVVVGDAPDMAVSLSAGFCGYGTPEIRETIDDLLVLVKVVAYDGPGNVAAFAQSCMRRPGSGLPLIAVVYVDSDDVSHAVANGVLEAMLAHEIGHALGIGTQWNEGATPLVAVPLGYQGQFARDAAARVGVTASPDAHVPVAWLPGGRSAHHWDAVEMPGELMSPYISERTPAISRVTVAALRDLGYDVAESAASAFVPAAAQQGGAGASGLVAARPVLLDLSHDHRSR